MELDIVLPVFEEQEVIEYSHRELVAELEKLENFLLLDWRIIYCLDHSRDETEKILIDIARQDPRVFIISMVGRSGHQNAIMKGVEFSRENAYLVIMDADGQHPPSVIGNMLQKLQPGPFVVHAVRVQSRDPRLLVRILSLIFYRLLRLISNVEIAPGKTDFKLLSPLVAQVIRKHYKDSRVFLRAFIESLQFPSSRVEFNAPERKFGKSKFSYMRLFRFAFSGVLSFSTKPLTLISVIGAATLFLALILSSFTVYLYFAENSQPPGYSTLVIVFLFFSSIQILSLGAVGIYLVQVLEQLRSRPRSIVSNVYHFDSK